MTLQGLSLIANTKGSPNGLTFHARNPATGAVLGPAYHTASEDEVRRAAASAADAFPTYRRLPNGARAVFLRRIAEEIESLGDLLLQRFVEETGLPLARAGGERARTCAQLRMFADLVADGSWVDARIDHSQPLRQPQPKPDTRSKLIGLGPVAVFGPANFPLAFSVAGGDTASALAAGCPVVVKAHSSHPGVSEYVGFAVQRAAVACDLPPGVFSVLFGGGRDIGVPLVKDPRIKGVGFTGSRSAGRELYDLCCIRPHPIPFFGELSSLNPVFILPAKLRDEGVSIAKGLHASVTLGVGQFCTSPGIVLVSKGASADGFVETLRTLMQGTPQGTMLNIATRQSYSGAVAQVSSRPGVETLASVSPNMSGSHAGATLLRSDVKTFQADPALQREMFGPATLLLEHGGKAEVLAFADSLEGHLTATLFGTSSDLEDYADLISILETKVGRLVFNGFPTGVEVCPSMVHSGPWPATTDCRFGSVGTAAIYRWTRPICYQNAPDVALPSDLGEANVLRLDRLVDGKRAPAPSAKAT